MPPFNLVAVDGIEPSLGVYEAPVLPLNYTAENWLRERELHPRPPAYDAGKLLLLYPANCQINGGPEGNRTLHSLLAKQSRPLGTCQPT